MGKPLLTLVEGADCFCDLCGAEISTEPVNQFEKVKHWALVSICHDGRSVIYRPGWNLDLCPDCEVSLRTKANG